MILYILFILLGMAMLVFGADALIRGGESIAKHYKIPNIVIGFTIIAFGTSAPELIVGVFSALKGVGDITIGNVIGSNIFNLMFVLGITSLIIPIKVETNSLKKYTLFSIIVFMLLLLLGNDILFKNSENTISRIDGIIFIIFFTIYMIMNYKLFKKTDFIESEIKIYSFPVSIILFLIGIILLGYGGDITIRNAVLLARKFNISEKVIGLTIIAIGTSLPELLTSLIATLKHKPNIAVGNIIGSNIFNILLVLGVSSVIRPFNYNAILNTDIIILIIFSIILVIMVFVNRNRYINRISGSLLLLLFSFYYIFILLRK